MIQLPFQYNQALYGTVHQTGNIKQKEMYKHLNFQEACRHKTCNNAFIDLFISLVFSVRLDKLSFMWKRLHCVSTLYSIEQRTRYIRTNLSLLILSIFCKSRWPILIVRLLLIINGRKWHDPKTNSMNNEHQLIIYLFLEIISQVRFVYSQYKRNLNLLGVLFGQNFNPHSHHDWKVYCSVSTNFQIYFHMMNLGQRKTIKISHL